MYMQIPHPQDQRKLQDKDVQELAQLLFWGPCREQASSQVGLQL